MTKIAKINKETLQNFRAEFNKDLAVLSKKYGIVLAIGNISFNDSGFNTKLSATLGSIGDFNGNAPAQYQIDLKTRGAMYGLTPEIIAKTHIIGREKATIVGLLPRARKAPVVVQFAGKPGKLFKVTLAEVGVKSLFAV